MMNGRLRTIRLINFVAAVLTECVITNTRRPPLPPARIKKYVKEETSMVRETSIFSEFPWTSTARLRCERAWV